MLPSTSSSNITIVPISPQQINFFIKHVGAIFRKLFQVALAGTKRCVDSNRLLEVCPGLERRLTDEFDERLWMLMETAADKTHLSLEPMFSILNPNLPYFHPVEDEEDKDLYEMSPDGVYVKTPGKSENSIEETGLVSRLLSLFSVDDKKAKQLLRERGRELATQKKTFLPEARTSMINEDETDKIILSAFKYVMALQELIQTNLNFFTSHYLYNEFKDNIATFPRAVSSNDNWKDLIPNDSNLDESIKDIQHKLSEIKSSLADVSKMQNQF